MCDDLSPGYVYLPNVPKAHPWVIISEPGSDDGQVLVVNWSTMESWKENVCILRPEDHPSIDRDSTLIYSRSYFMPTEKIRASVRNGDLIELERVSPSVLRRIITGARKSTRVSNDKKQVLPS